MHPLEVNNLMNFSKFIHLCNHHYNQVLNISVIPETPQILFTISSYFYPQSQATTNLLWFWRFAFSRHFI